MKKLSFIVFAAFAVTAAAGLAACGGGSEDPAIHSITYTESQNYSVISLAESGQTGSNILFDVRSESVFYEIDQVTCNGTPITKGSLGYKFVMPDEDVRIEVELTPITQYDDPDDYLSWSGSVADEISMASEQDKEYSWDCTQELPLAFDMSKFGSYNTQIITEFASSDESVIPSDALSFKAITGSNDNIIRGGKIVVDLKKISAGVASVYFRFDSNNASAAELIRTFTVTEYGGIELDCWNVPLNIVNDSNFDDTENIFITFTDSSPVYGSNAPKTQSFTLADLENGATEIIYAVGHTYRISASHAVWNEEEGRYEALTELYVYDWVGSGSSESGFNRIVGGILTLASVPLAPIEITLYD